jgi:uncharacterized RDD family membrane protein YckC
LIDSAQSKSKVSKSIKLSAKKPQDSATSSTAVSVTLASFWKRLFAWVYDLLGALGIFVLAVVVGQILLYLVTLPFVEEFNSVAIAASKSIFWTMYLLATIQYYYCWCWVKGGQTVGMKAWNLQLYKKNGSLLNWKEAYIRSLLSLGGLANLWCLIDPQKRSWHDILVDSRVVVLPKDFYKNKNQKPLI